MYVHTQNTLGVSKHVSYANGMQLLERMNMQHLMDALCECGSKAYRISTGGVSDSKISLPWDHSVDA